MYRAFFNLQSKPFELAPDAGFLWLGEKHKEALAALRYGILENKGFVLLTGGPGSGKTTLVNALVAGLGPGVLSAVISDPSRDRLDFYNAIASGFGLAKEFTSKVQFLIGFSQFLHKAEEDGKKVLLVIDDCQRLSQEMLEELRLLSNIEKADAKLINIFFVGLREFNEILIQPNNRAMRQRLTIKVDLPPLTLAESQAYVEHRLTVAGSGEKLFSAKAMQIIHKHSMGIPKRINIACDQALVAACVQGKPHFDHKLVEESLQPQNPPHPPGGEAPQGEAEPRPPEPQSGHPLSAREGKANAAVDGADSQGGGRSALRKYGVIGVVLAGAILAFSYYGTRSPEVTEVAPVKIGASVPVGQVSGEGPVAAARDTGPSAVNDRPTPELPSAAVEKPDDQGEGGRVLGVAAPASVAPGGSAIPDPIPPPATLEDAKAEVAQLSAPPAESPKEAQGSRPAPPRQSSPLPTKVILPLAANSLKLTPEGHAELTALLAKLAAVPTSRLQVKGFVSSSTASPANTKLSQERAAAVANLLVAGGIAAERLEVKGMGIADPIAGNDTPEGRNRNRRVEIVILEGAER